jgi:transcriptional regulator with XRE-family HTH domain
MISRLIKSNKYRAAYVRAKAQTNIPSQIRALRLRRGMTQQDLAREADMKQPRISAMEQPGETQFNLDTLVRLAAAFKVGLIVRFSSYSQMLAWENEFNQDSFDVIHLENDNAFLQEREPATAALNLARIPERYQNEPKKYQDRPSGGVYGALSGGFSSIHGIRGDVGSEPRWQGILPGPDSGLGQTM